MKSDLIKKFVIGSKEYSLSRTELRIADLKKPQNVQTLKLNELDTNFEYIKQIPLARLVWLAIYICASIILVMINKTTLNSSHFIYAPVVIILSLYFFKKNYVNAWRIYYAFKPGIALTINNNKKNQQNLQQFMQALSTQVKQAEKPIDFILHLLKQYGLVTFNEFNKMITTIAEQKTQRIQSNVIDIKDRIK